MMRSKRLMRVGSTVVLFGAASLASADHNSVWGEGWAKMPNDIHNTRVETLNSGDRAAFRDFVRYGNGAAATNRFLSDSPSRRAMTATRGGGGRGGRR
jgi:hypothetical protein